MDEITVIKIVFGILLGLGGMVLLILAFALGWKYMVQEKRCTAKASGTVFRYAYGSKNGGVRLPVVRYTVDGREYKVTGPQYKAYVSVSKTSPTAENTQEYSEDNQVFKVRNTNNSFVGIVKNPMSELYPLGSQIDVFYDPQKPKLAYVLRYCNLKYIFWVLFSGAVLVWLIDLLILLLL